MSVPDTPAGAGLTGALDAMTRALAEASPASLACLAGCRQCRNHLLYVLDTAQFRADGDYGMFTRRLRATADIHDHLHSRPDGPDSAVPQIRGVTA